MSESYNSILERMNNRENKKLLYSLAGFVVVFVAVVATSFMLLNQQQDVRQRASEKPVVEQPSVPDEILLKFKPGAKKNIQDRILNENALTVIKDIPQIEVKAVKVAPEARDHVIDALTHNPAIDFAEKRIISKTIDITPNDPQFSLNQWDLAKISAPAAWEISTGTPVVVAVLDTGFWPGHPDLLNKSVAGNDFVNNDSDPMDDNGHGTGVASRITFNTNNGIGAAGINWQAKIMPVKICNSQGGCAYSMEGIIWATDNGAKVINMSFGAPNPGSCTSYEQSAIDYAWSHGVVLVGAVGNDSLSYLYSPAKCNHVIAVGATDPTDNRTLWSDYGPELDVVAPGASVLVASLSGGYASGVGTSYASPQVAGLASLLFSKSNNNTDIVNAITSGADDMGDPGWDQYYGFGRINAFKSLQLITGITPTPADTQPPTVNITSPTTGSAASGGITVSVDALDNASVSKVELYVDGALFASDSNSPYSFFIDTSTLSNGNHTLLAKATDTSGNVGSSNTITLNVSNTTPTTTPLPTNTPAPTLIPSPTLGSFDSVSPIVSISAPIAGSTVAVRSNVNIQTTASDNIGVTRIEFRIGTTLTCTDTSAPYNCTWKVPGAKNKSYTISAKAYDGAGNNSQATISVVAK